MTGTLILLAQVIVYFAVMAALVRARDTLGVGVFVCALGVTHFLETYLAIVLLIQLPFGLVSPGSTALFTGKLSVLLLLYLKEDAETVRQPIYGLLIGILLTVALAWLLHADTPNLSGAQPDLALLNNLGVLMVWGTLLLFADSIGLVLLYERLSRSMAGRVVLPAAVSLVIVLSFDQLMFFAVLRLITGAPLSALFGGWLAKIAGGLLCSLLIGAYLRWFDTQTANKAAPPIGALFERLTYRGRYERLLKASATDALTGVLDRRQLEESAQLCIDRALAAGRAISLELIDIDHFKRVNDTLGHLAGDTVLRHVGRTLQGAVRSNDKVFRYGGEEFVILCEGMSHAVALAHAERIRASMPRALEAAGASPVTVSIGVATAPEDGRDLLEILDRADHRLYAAKREGRDRVVGERPVAAPTDAETATAG